MLDKKTCRNIILEAKPYINISAVCRACGLSRISLVSFLKSSEFDSFISLERINTVVNFIQNIGC